ncbi:MAG TPA: hypothetical protein VK999_03980 [Methylotenera sp.]|nr:hypothetical protein [Methylotenera sp.]
MSTKGAAVQLNNKQSHKTLWVAAGNALVMAEPWIAARRATLAAKG